MSAESSAPSEPVWAIVLAAGSGQRYGAAKQFLHLDGRSLLDWVFDALAPLTDRIVAVLPDGTPCALPSGARRVIGGATRLDSVRAGLAAIPAGDDAIVVVHDPAHPLAPTRLFVDVVAAVRAGADGAVPGLAMVEVIKVVDAYGWVTSSRPKDGVVIVQTPQAFRLGVLRRAHAGAPGGVEDSELVERSGGRVRVVRGDPANLHVTTPEELALAEAIVTGRKEAHR
jgi:2-C-methyl-D-erythritol 4-phosphate cytidylyltransferase